MENKFKFTILGSRGSVPVEGEKFSIYGGATSCYKIKAGNEEIYLDAGSGIVSAEPSPNSHITVLLTHMHLDHILGLPFFLALTQKNRPIDIYAEKRSGLLPDEAIDRLISNPFWPIKIRDYPANVNIYVLSERGKNFSVGDVTVDFIEGSHPGGSTIYRLTCGGKSLVYATDFEHNPVACEMLADFAQGTNLLLYDAQYTQAEYPACRGYGHSTPEAGLEVAANAKADKLLFVHHAPWRDDKSLAEMERTFGAGFAKVGEEILFD